MSTADDSTFQNSRPIFRWQCVKLCTRQLDIRPNPAAKAVTLEDTRAHVLTWPRHVRSFRADFLRKVHATR